MSRSVTVDVPNRRISIVLGPVGPEISTVPITVSALPSSIFWDAMPGTADIVALSGTYSDTYSNTYAS